MIKCRAVPMVVLILCLSLWMVGRKLKKILDKINEAKQEQPAKGALASMAEDGELQADPSEDETPFQQPHLRKTSSNDEFSDFIAGKGELDPGNKTIHGVVDGKDIFFKVSPL